MSLFVRTKLIAADEDKDEEEDDDDCDLVVVVLVVVTATKLLVCLLFFLEKIDRRKLKVMAIFCRSELSCCILDIDVMKRCSVRTLHALE